MELFSLEETLCDMIATCDVVGVVGQRLLTPGNRTPMSNLALISLRPLKKGFPVVPSLLLSPSFSFLFADYG